MKNMRRLFSSKSPARQLRDRPPKSSKSKKQKDSKNHSDSEITETMIARMLQLENMIGKPSWTMVYLNELVMLYSVRTSYL